LGGGTAATLTAGTFLERVNRNQDFVQVSRSLRLIQMKVAIESRLSVIWGQNGVPKLQEFIPFDAVRFDNSFEV